MKYEKEYRQKHPETIGEIDSHFDLSNYSEFLESELAEAKSNAAPKDLVWITRDEFKKYKDRKNLLNQCKDWIQWQLTEHETPEHMKKGSDLLDSLKVSEQANPISSVG